MTWHLKNEELERKLLSIDPEFVEKLTVSVSANEEKHYFEIFFSDGETNEDLGVLRFMRHELKESIDFDASGWIRDIQSQINGE